MSRPAGKTQAEVLEVLRSQAKPLSAYQIIDRLHGRSGKVAPTTVYRALTALIATGRAHRIESANAFMACRNGCRGEDAVLAICGECGAVDEHPAVDVLASLAAIASSAGFSPRRHVIELHGRCAACAAGAGAEPTRT